MVVYRAHTSVLCCVPSNHARTHAYSRWIRKNGGCNTRTVTTLRNFSSLSPLNQSEAF